MYADNKERAAFFLLVWPTCTHFNLEVFKNIFPNVWNIGYWLIPTGYENFRTIAICTVCLQVCSLEVGLKWMENILSSFFFKFIQISVYWTSICTLFFFLVAILFFSANQHHSTRGFFPPLCQTTPESLLAGHIGDTLYTTQPVVANCLRKCMGHRDDSGEFVWG